MRRTVCDADAAEHMKSVAVGAHAEPLAALCGAPPDAVAEATRARSARIPSIAESHHELTGGDLSRKPCLASLVEELAEDQLRQQKTCASNEIPPLADENLLTPKFCHALVAAARHDALPHAAVTIVAYREPELLRRTLRRLRSPRFARMVHLDLRTDAAFEAAVLALADEEAAAGAPLCVVKSHTIVYRTGTDIEVVMGALAWWVARAPAGRFDYFVPLTGSDYPLWTADELSWLLREAETGRDGPVTWLRAGPGHAQCRRGAALMDRTSVEGRVWRADALLRLPVRRRRRHGRVDRCGRSAGAAATAARVDSRPPAAAVALRGALVV